MRLCPRRAVSTLLPFLLLLTFGCEPDVEPAAPAPPAAVSGAVQAALERGDLGRALAVVDSAVARHPDRAELHFLHGTLLTELNRFAQAEAAFERTLAIDPYYRGAHFRLGNSAFLQGQYRAALERYGREQETMERSPQELRARYADVDRAARPSILLQMGRAHKLLGETEAARAAYTEALALDSLQHKAYNWISEIDEEMGDRAAALEGLARARALDPANPDYRYRQGVLLNQMGRTREAVDLLGPLVEARPWHEGTNYNLGQALLRLGHEEAGRFYLARADTMQQIAAEVAQAQAAAYQQPENHHRWRELADVLLYAGRLDEAQQAFGAALALRPGDLAMQNDAANLALARGDTLAALSGYRRALAQDSSFADAWFNLGVLHATSGRYDEARSAWEAALRHAPGHPEAQASLVRLAQLR